MNIYLYGKNYQMTSTNMIDNELYMYLKDEQNQMFKKSVSDIILFLYKNKAHRSFQNYNSVEELKNDLVKVDQFLSDVKEYQYIKQTVSKFTVNQEHLNQAFYDILKAYESWRDQHANNSEVIQAPQVQTSTVPNEAINQNEEALKYQAISSNELLIRLQMYPNHPENDAIRAELERRETTQYKDQQAAYMNHKENELVKVKRLEQRSNMMGFAMNALLSFLAGMVVGIWILVLINILVRI